MSGHTDINKITDLSSADEEEKIDESNMARAVVDLSLSLETRIKAINMFVSIQGTDNTIEIINKLVMMYDLTNIKLLRQYLYEICEKSSINAFLKSIAATGLCTHDENDEIGYKAIDLIYPDLGNIGTPYKIELIKLLMNCNTFQKNARDHFCNTIDDQTINCDYRYKSILSLEYTPDPEDSKMTAKEKSDKKKKDEEKIKKMNYFIQEACLVFVKNHKNSKELRILASQNLLQRFGETIDEQTRNYIQTVLLELAKNVENDYNLRADATDVLLQLGDPDTKKLAQEIILNLGVGKRKVATLYDNAQNVHTKQIEESVKDALEFLQSSGILKIQGKQITTEYVTQKILEFAEESKFPTEKLKIAINRICMDRALYSKYNCTLEHILLQIWSYIIGHPHAEEMKKRLLEEMTEMAGTCSSGYATRLINTISGFGDFSVRISWREQIIANFTGRLNARIRDMDNLSLQEKVLNEMTAENTNYENRKNFLKFLRKNILDVRGELYEEFKTHMSDVDFDLYFRAAVSMYETGRFD